MNRKERRAAGKLAKSGGHSGSDALFAAALRHQQAGELMEADKLCRQILAADPRHLRGLQLLGIIALQIGRHAAAAELFGAALALDERIVDCHYNIAYALRALGRLEEAAAHYRRTVALAPNHADAHVNLGNLLVDQGKLEDAAAFYRRALALAPGSAATRYNLGNVLARQNRFEEAVAEYERALALAPDHALVHNNLGIARFKQGDADAALAHHRRAASLDPKLAEAQLGIGNVLGARGEPEAAAAAFRRAVAIRPDYAEAHNNLGAALVALGQAEEAAACYRRALAATPPFPKAYVNLARLLLSAGRTEEALTLARRALEIEDSPEPKSVFVQAVRGSRFTADDGGFRALMLRALTQAWGRPAELAPAAVSLIRLDPALEDAVARASAAWPALLPAEELLGPAGFSAIAKDDLLRTLLELVPVPDIGLERMLTSLRASLRALAGEASAVDANVLRLACALARQGFIDEYAFACSDAERAEAERLAERLVAAAPDVSPLGLAAVGAYLPLHSLKLDALLARGWPDAVAALLDQQLREPREEAALRAAIPRLTPIESGVSVQVKQQYEENPYPRWIAAAPAGPPRAIDDYLRETFPLAPFRPLGKTGLDLLIAGCGTGQHAIETARQFNNGRALAVDLSRASLAYAARTSRALGLDIEYGEADILALDTLGRSFDVIEASGVLHHLADPPAAWRLLLSLLRPGGVMNVGLYSELGRRHVVRGRAFIAEQGYDATADGIRTCRQALMASDDPLLREITASGDFFSLSGCRDLLFHVEEHRLTLPQIAAFIAAQGLTFLGFETSAAVQLHYRSRFPDDKAMTDLDQWHAFECENPRAFSAMYQFWIQKP